MSQNLTSIRRDAYITPTLTASTNAATTGSFPMGAYAGGLIICVSGSVTLNFLVRRSQEETTGYLLKDSSGTTIALTVSSGNAYPIPDEAFAAPCIAIQTTSGTGTFQVILKG